MRNKIRNVSHQELNWSDILQALDVDAIIREGRDLFLREGHVWGIVPAKDWMPSFVLDNVDRFEHLIADCDSSAGSIAVARTLIAEGEKARASMGRSALCGRAAAKIAKFFGWRERRSPAESKSGAGATRREKALGHDLTFAREATYNGGRFTRLQLDILARPKGASLPNW